MLDVQFQETTKNQNNLTTPDYYNGGAYKDLKAF